MGDDDTHAPEPGGPLSRTAPSREVDLTFGPVPSRRLGSSLGVNPIPPKHCSYACVYCQLGRTPRMTITRQPFHDPAAVADAVGRALDGCRQRGVPVDYVTIVPDGEPTLDANLGRLIGRLRPLGPPVAVITNGSLLHLEDVRTELTAADWVSVKVDAVLEPAWRLVDRPHGKLRLDGILEGLRRFASDFGGTLVTETMLVDGLNDGPREQEALAAFLGELQPSGAFLAAPIRPPAEPWVRPAAPEAFVRAFEILSAAVTRVEYLVGDPPPPSQGSGDLERDLLAITAVHPLDEDAVVALGGSPDALRVAHRLASEGALASATHRGRTFFLHAGVAGGAATRRHLRE